MGKRGLLETFELTIRAKWWLMKPADVTQETMPPDVRNFVLQRATRQLEKAIQAEVSPEKRVEIFEELCRPVFEGGEWTKWDITDKTVDLMIGVAFKYLSRVPLVHCINCNRPVLSHQATKVTAGYLCESCANEGKTQERV